MVILQDELDCKEVGVFLQIVLKESKSSVRASRMRSARASHALRACEAREKEPTVRFPYDEFVLTTGLKNVVELSKIYSQLRPLCKFDTPGDWFRERIARVTFVCTWLRIFCNDDVLHKLYSFELIATSPSHGQFPLAKFWRKLLANCQVMFARSHLWCSLP